MAGTACGHGPQQTLCERCQHIVALRALLAETLPSIQHHANKRRKGVEKFRKLGTPHGGAERRLSYLDNLQARITQSSTSQSDKPEAFVVTSEMMTRIYNTLSGYANITTYEPPRTGGVLQGCPRGPAPTPMQLTLGARLTLRIIDRELLGRKDSSW